MVELEEKKPVGLYVHIPFCARKCAYCDFLSGPASEETKEKYVNLLCEEIEREAVRYPGYQGKTIFFGGGTPTVLRPEQLEKVLCKLNACFSVESVESTLECNPGTVDEESLRRLRDMGFNRLSIGLQSAQDKELKKLGRIHDWEDFLETYEAARRVGFQNINVDIMSALPGQNLESYMDTLRRVIVLCPEHVSAYSLIIEEGTPFYERYGKADRERQKYGEDREHLLPTEEEERRMYEMTEALLARRGYYRYEISNYARPGYECRHNITYWKRGNYLGFGLGAASLMENCRFTKVRDMGEYEKLFMGSAGCFYREEQCLSEQEQMEEFMFLGLRLMKGISAKEFREYFHVPIEEIYGDVLEKLREQKLLARSGEKIFLTKKGVDVSNMVLVEFLF